eukprot:766754-Hanusia_phi.AAC.1
MMWAGRVCLEQRDTWTLTQREGSRRGARSSPPPAEAAGRAEVVGLGVLLRLVADVAMALDHPTRNVSATRQNRDLTAQGFSISRFHFRPFLVAVELQCTERTRGSQ